jgi:hypothetical protein
MSLNWDFTKCPTWKKSGELNNGNDDFAMHLPDGTPIEWAVTEALIWASMGVGYGWDIKKDIEEFVFRVMVYQEVVGRLLSDGNKPRLITPDEVRAHAGMDTNVSTITRAKFLSNMGKTIGDRIERKLKTKEAL